MSLLKNILVLIVLSLNVTPAFAQTNPAVEVGITAVPVADRIYMIERMVGNIAISVGEEGVLVVDEKAVPLASIDEEAIRKLSSAPIRMMNGKDNILTSFNGEEIRTTSFSNGSNENHPVIYFVTSNVVYLGQHFFAGQFPQINVAAGDDVEKFTDNISVILNAIPNNAKIIPGYGPVSTKDDLINFQRMLIETTILVGTQIDDGKDRETILREGLGEQWANWGNGIVTINQWIETIYDSLMRKKTQ
jgi:hypothetical protein